MAQLGVSNADLNKMSRESELTVREHCDSLRQQVDIARETALESIHRASDTLMSDIDAYERECLSSWTAASKESTDVTLEDMTAFLAEQQAFLQSVQASDDNLILNKEK